MAIVRIGGKFEFVTRQRDDRLRRLRIFLENPEVHPVFQRAFAEHPPRGNSGAWRPAYTSCERLNGLFNAHLRQPPPPYRPFYSRESASNVVVIEHSASVCPIDRSIDRFARYRAFVDRRHSTLLPPFRSLPRFSSFSKKRNETARARSLTRYIMAFPSL